jgi:hypothetical protein
VGVSAASSRSVLESGEEAVFSKDFSNIDHTINLYPLAILFDRDYLKIKENREITNHGTTQSRKAEEGQDQPQTATILQENRII